MPDEEPTTHSAIGCVRREVAPVQPAGRSRTAPTVPPHQGLGQRTPVEVFYARDTRAKSVPLRSALCVEHFAADPSLPVLSLRRAA